MTERKTSLVVCDAGPLIHLDEVGCLDLLADFSEVLVPDAVRREVQRHRPAHSIIRRWCCGGFLRQRRNRRSWKPWLRC